MFCFVCLDVQELSHLLECDVKINFRQYQNVVLQESSLQHCIPILATSLLVILQVFVLERLYISALDDVP